MTYIYVFVLTICLNVVVLVFTCISGRVLFSVKAECHVKLHQSAGRYVGYATKISTVNGREKDVFPVIKFKIKMLIANKCA